MIYQLHGFFCRWLLGLMSLMVHPVLGAVVDADHTVAAVRGWLRLEASPLGACVVASDLSASVTVTIQPKTLTGGPASTHPVVLRQSALAPTDLFLWFREIYRGNIERRTVEFRLGSFRLQGCEGAWPCSYKLVLGDDGLPYEEYDLIYDQISGL